MRGWAKLARSLTPPPPLLPSAGLQDAPAWPRLPPPCAPRAGASDEEFDSANVCVVRCGRSMAELEQRLCFAMVAYVGGTRHDL